MMEFYMKRDKSVELVKLRNWHDQNIAQSAIIVLITLTITAFGLISVFQKAIIVLSYYLFLPKL